MPMSSRQSVIKVVAALVVALLSSAVTVSAACGRMVKELNFNKYAISPVLDSQVSAFRSKWGFE
jgi:hypothetical protein